MTTSQLLLIIKPAPSAWWKLNAYDHFESTKKRMKPGDIYIWAPERIDGITMPHGYGYNIELTATGWKINLRGRELLKFAVRVS